MNKIFIAFLVTLISGLSTTIGALFMYLRVKNINRFICISLSFSGAIMFFISLFELIPDGFFYLQSKFGIVVAFLILICMIFLGNVIIEGINTIIDKKKSNASSLYKVGILSMIGLMIHNMPEGVLTFLSSSIDLELGIKLSIAIMLHNIPEGIAIAVPIYYGKGKKSSAFLYTFLSGFSELFGAIIAFLFLYKYLSNTMISIILLLVAGIMISISFNEIYTEVAKYKKKHMYIGVLLGLIIVILTEFVL